MRRQPLIHPRRHTLAVGIALTLLLVQPATAHAFLGIALVGAASYLVGKGLIDEAKGAVKEGIAAADRAVQARINQAGDRADQSIKNAGEEVRKSLKEAERILLEAIDKAAKEAKELQQKTFDDAMRLEEKFFKDLDRQQVAFFARAEVLLDGVGQRLETIVDGAIRVTTDELALLREDMRNTNLTGNPLHKKEFRVQRVTGQAQVYRETGEHKFAVLGAGVGSEAKVTLIVDGKEIPKERQRAEPYLRTFTVPAEALAPYFGDLKSVEKTLLVKSDKDLGKTGEVKVVLLPKYPARYQLTFHLENGKELQGFAPFDDGEFNFTKAEERLVRDRRGKGEDADRAVRERMGTLLGLSKTHLRFGTTLVDLPKEASGFLLDVWYLNGDHVVLTRSHRSDGGVTASWSDVSRRHLRIDIKPELRK